MTFCSIVGGLDTCISEAPWHEYQANLAARYCKGVVLVATNPCSKTKECMFPLITYDTPVQCVEITQWKKAKGI